MNISRKKHLITKEEEIYMNAYDAAEVAYKNGYRDALRKVLAEYDDNVCIVELIKRIAAENNINIVTEM